MDHRQSLKEVVRHLLFRTGLTSAIDIIRRRRGRSVDHMGKSARSDVFSDIYANQVWLEWSGQTSLSGAGSVASTTDDLRRRLVAFLEQIGCRKIVDVGCGDFNWMKDVVGDRSYVGFDIVPSVIAENEKRYGEANRRFVCQDVSVDPISDDGDVLICREVLFHLSFRTALALLRNVNARRFRYILLTSDSSIWFNSDIRDGDFRRINLLKSPFRFPKPALVLTDDKVSEGRVLAIWNGADLSSCLT